MSGVRLGPQTGVVYCLRGVPINICHLLSGEFTETSFQRTKYFALLTWSSGNTSFCLSSLLSRSPNEGDIYKNQQKIQTTPTLPNIMKQIKFTKI